MRKKEVAEIVLKITDGVFSTIIDLVLWNIFFMYEISPTRHSRQIRKAEFLASKRLTRINSKSIKKAIYYAKTKGWIKDDLRLTEEGIQRLNAFTPGYLGKRKWDGNWHLVSYDIPESKRKYRDLLRLNLKKLDFGEMHASLWISPFNFLGEVEKIVKDYNLSSYVILSISNKVGREESRIFAQKIWKLDKLNRSYQNLLEKAKRGKKENLIFKYLAVLKNDPQLPKELLPEDWIGDKAHLLFYSCL